MAQGKGDPPVSARYTPAGARAPARQRLTTGLDLDDDDRRQLQAAMPLDLRSASRIEAAKAREGRGAHPHLPPEPPLRNSAAQLAHSVEARIVEAIWTLQRLPDRERAWVYGPQRHGLDYLADSADRWANAVDPATGVAVGFGEMAARPAPPSAKECDRWVEALAWLSILPRDKARLVFGAAASRQGDMRRRVSWARARAVSGMNVTRQRLAVIYDQSIAEIAAELVVRAARNMRNGI